MGNIDKEKWDRLSETGAIDGYVIANFDVLKEKQIDFDTLYNEYLEEQRLVNSAASSFGFRDFLKSKNLTAPKPIEIPVKRYWKLKPEFQEFAVLFEVDEGINFRSETYDAKYAKYYDEIKEPDYSAIPKGSIVEYYLEGKRVVEIFKDLDIDDVWIGNITNFRIVELAKE